MNIAGFVPNRAVSTRLKLSLRRLLCEECSVYMGVTSDGLLRYLQGHRVDMVFLQADAPNATWRALHEQVIRLQPSVKTVLIADTDAYAVDAIRAHIHGYLVTPIKDIQLLHAFSECG